MSKPHEENADERIPEDETEVNPPQSEAERLRELFAEIELPEITKVDFAAMSHQEIARLLPSFGGGHPAKAILIDQQSGKAFGIASGWNFDTMAHHGMLFKSGGIGLESARQAGKTWQDLGNHTEAVAAAFMRKMGITDAVVYINTQNPCWGLSSNPGCYFRLPEMLAENSRMTVYNKMGQDFASSRPEREFHFEGASDDLRGGTS